MNPLLATLVSGFLLSGHTGASQDVRSVLADVNKLRAEVAQQRKSGAMISREQESTALEAIAAKGLEGVDLAKIPESEISDWLEVLRLAHRSKELATLSSRAASVYTFKAWQAQQDELEALVQDGKGQEAVNVLRYATVSQVNMLAQMAEFVHSTMTAKFLKSDPKVLVDAYDALLCRMDPSRLTSKSDRQWADICYVNVMLQRYDLLRSLGHKDEALAGLEKLRTRFGNSKSTNAYGGTTLAAIDRMKESWGMVRSVAPDLVVTQTIGSFGNVTSLRGKVVVLDFFAHWCVPCKRAFPELRDFYSHYKDRGLALVGVTSFYGYFGNEQNMKPNVEFEKMEHFVKDMNLTWPIAFDPQKSFEKSYGVGAIPQIVIIDRKGMIRMVQVGYEPAKKEVIEAEISKLLDEKA